MSIAATLEYRLPSGKADWAARLHVARGVSRAVALTLHNTAFYSAIFPDGRLRPTVEEAAELRRRMIALYEADWQNVRDGLYPESLANDFSWGWLLSAYPRVALDALRIRRRAHINEFNDLPEGVDNYPPYYRRNFHFQTDGYLGLDSADLYEQQVELLFTGSANAMRRQVLPPLVRALKGKANKDLRVLDLACGTGVVLRMLAAALPGAHLYGCDLSPYYIAHARKALADIVPLSLVAENAEALPFRDGHFDAISCVYLFHELPPAVRDRVLKEAARVLKPGGTLVIADSIQTSDAPELKRHLEHFPKQFHEPFYPHYLHDDLRARLDKAGFDVVESTQAFVTKITSARRRSE